MKILSLLVSDKVIIDNDTKKVTIEGIFDSIGALNFPAKHKELTVSLITHGTAGKHHYKISITKDNKEIASVNEEVSTGTNHRFFARFTDIVFPEPGVYAVKAIVDKEELTTDFNLNLLKEIPKL
ncbi:MAG: hypothetical protein CEE43_17030 [Promethearchaeota archaeon Loki_b32]|nr:MAG: hypothetical protein CEE43_17030 [Candidatus Lokiarchaeota archaeon Loki_b32]